jgi:putative MATE family efflux protein
MAATVSHSNLQLGISDRQILKIALPISFALLVPQLNFITNTIFQGMLGTKELGSAGITNVYYLIFAVIGFGLNNGLQSLISRRAGANRINEIGKIFSQGVYTALFIALIGIVLTYTLAPVILKLTLPNAEEYNRDIHYLHIRIWGLPFLYLYQMRNALLIGTNNSKFLVWGTLAETVTNIFFDYSLILGHFGFPKLGFDGAAYASIVAEFTGMMVVLMIISKKGISKRFLLFDDFSFDRKAMRMILVQSAPLIIQFGISLLAWEFFYILIARFGVKHDEMALAVSNSMRNIFGLFGVFVWAFAATTNTMVSNIIGQGKQDQVIYLIRRILRLAVSFTLILCLLLNIFPTQFLMLFNSSEAFIKDGIIPVRIVACALVLMAMANTWLNSVTGTGNTKVNLLIELFAVIMYSIYVYMVLEKLELSINWAWASEILYWLCLFVPSYFYMQSGRWKNKVI